MIRIDISSKFPDMKAARTLASDITTQAAELYDILGKELEQQVFILEGLKKKKKCNL